MGCINSKNNGSVVSPAAGGCGPRVSRSCTAFSFSKSLTRRQSGRSEDVNREKVEGSSCRSVSTISGQLMRRSKRGSSGNNDSFSVKSGPAHRLVEGEQVAVGWPPWLSSAAGEAVDGWLPLRADAYEKLEKIGQGTYSSVFRAREVKTGRTVALKKVRFDNLQPESIRFMAREIMILRRLDHPNIMKLEGVITSTVSSSLYLVFEYMDHDLSGLNSCPYVKFTEAQVKCFMKQLISGIEHCHSKGIMHRDIKASNILVSSQGILKIADFGLANFITPKNRNQLTSRVVTLWYRPPELLLGTTSYGVTIDLWSVGCVFAELLIRKPLLKGRTEVEQLHKIFKLCGSPSEDYWRKIHHSPMYRPYHGSCLRERFRELPEPTVDLLETLLSVEPQERGTASSALMSEYFNTKPYPCNPSSLPKYPPNKEMDAKFRDELRRKRNRLRARDSGATRKQIKPSISNTCTSLKADMKGRAAPFPMKFNIKPKDGAVPNLSAADTMSEASEATTVISQADIYTAPLEIPGSTNFSWAKKRKDSSLSTLSYSSLSSSSIASTADSASFNFSNNPFNKITEGKEYNPGNVEATNPVLKKIQAQFEQQHEFEHDEPYEFEQDDPDDDVRIEQLPRNRSLASRSLKPADAIKKNMGKPELSGPLICHQHKIDQLLQRNEDHIRQKSRFENTEK